MSIKSGWVLSCLSLLCLMGSSISAYAQQDRVPPLQIYKAMADANKATGWVAFRNYAGQQLIYFTPVVTLHCRVTEIRYSLNGPELDQRFPLPDCHPALPFSLPTDAGVEVIALNLPEGSVDKVAVQIVFDDGSESDVLVYEPCDAVGDATCAWLIDG